MYHHDEKAVFQIRIHRIQILTPAFWKIRIRKNIQIFDDQKIKNFTLEKKLGSFLIIIFKGIYERLSSYTSYPPPPFKT
jgi:hypothetical protein